MGSQRPGDGGLPDVVKRLGDDIQWTTDLGNAFLAQQTDVMDAVQRMRKKAQDKGTLKTTEQQKVETKVVESKQVIVIEQANPQVVYVPTYDPVVVYGPPIYPYPPIYYPPAGYYAAGMAISFGVGIAMGAFWGGGWGWGCGWGGNDIYINHNKQLQSHGNIDGGNRSVGDGGVGGVGSVVAVGSRRIGGVAVRRCRRSRWSRRRWRTGESAVAAATVPSTRRRTQQLGGTTRASRRSSLWRPGARPTASAAALAAIRSPSAGRAPSSRLAAGR